MASLNKVFIIGNLTRDPEMRYTPQGTAVANLRVAANRRFKDRNTGETKEEVCFINAVVWNKQAETCNQYLSKGRPVFIEGRLQSRNWEDAQGQKRSVIEIRAERVQFLGAPSQGQQTAPRAQNESANREASAYSSNPAPVASNNSMDESTMNTE